MRAPTLSSALAVLLLASATSCVGKDLPTDRESKANAPSFSGQPAGMPLESDSGSYKALLLLAKEPAPSILTKDYRPTDIAAGPSITGCGRTMENDIAWSWGGHDWSQLLIDLTTPSSFQVTMDSTGKPAGKPTVAQSGFEGFAGVQSRNQTVVTGFKNCWLNDRTSFLEGIAGAAPGSSVAVTYTWTGIKLNLEWQFAHNKAAIKNAQTAFADTAGIAPRARGMGFLLNGQRHNPVMQMAYRAAFRDDPTKLIGIVSAMK